MPQSGAHTQYKSPPDGARTITALSLVEVGDDIEISAGVPDYIFVLDGDTLRIATSGAVAARFREVSGSDTIRLMET